MRYFISYLFLFCFVVYKLILPRIDAQLVHIEHIYTSNTHIDHKHTPEEFEGWIFVHGKSWVESLHGKPTKGWREIESKILRVKNYWGTIIQFTFLDLEVRSGSFVGIPRIFVYEIGCYHCRGATKFSCTTDSHCFFTHNNFPEHTNPCETDQVSPCGRIPSSDSTEALTHIWHINHIESLIHHIVRVWASGILRTNISHNTHSAPHSVDKWQKLIYLVSLKMQVCFIENCNAAISKYFRSQITEMHHNEDKQIYMLSTRNTSTY